MSWEAAAGSGFAILPAISQLCTLVGHRRNPQDVGVEAIFAQTEDFLDKALHLEARTRRIHWVCVTLMLRMNTFTGSWWLHASEQRSPAQHSKDGTTSGEHSASARSSRPAVLPPPVCLSPRTPRLERGALSAEDCRAPRAQPRCRAQPRLPLAGYLSVSLSLDTTSSKAACRSAIRRMDVSRSVCRVCLIAASSSTYFSWDRDHSTCWPWARPPLTYESSGEEPGVHWVPVTWGSL